jgi:hypothetical protein
MWHAVAAVTDSYDPIICESPQASTVLIMNAGPDEVLAQGWDRIQPGTQRPQIEMRMKSGDQRALAGSLVRVHLEPGKKCAAVAWRVLR